MIKELLLEIKVFFGFGKWYKVFNTLPDAYSAIPNQKSILVHLGKTEICLARKDEVISAFENECPHHQMPLNRGKFNDKNEWICPYHRHCFNLQNGYNMTMPQTHPLTLFYVKKNDRGLFVYKPNRTK